MTFEFYHGNRTSSKIVVILLPIGFLNLFIHLTPWSLSLVKLTQLGLLFD